MPRGGLLVLPQVRSPRCRLVVLLDNTGGRAVGAGHTTARSGDPLAYVAERMRECAIDDNRE